MTSQPFLLRYMSFYLLLEFILSIWTCECGFGGRVSAIVNGHFSPARPFFVSVLMFRRDLTGYTVCGGTIIGPQWVVTSGECVNEGEATFVESGDFTHPAAPKRVYAVAGVYLHPDFMHLSGIHLFDVALIKTTGEFPRTNILPLCTEKRNTCTLMGVCGMGSTHANSNNPAATLQQAHVMEIRQDSVTQCQESLVCATSLVPAYISITSGDRGSPLYILDNQGHRVICLYGVASHNRVILNASGNFFTSVPFLHEWILQTMATN